MQQIVSKGLHHSDEDAMTYTMQLMEKLEAVSILPGLLDFNALSSSFAAESYEQRRHQG